jgi:hypothetical protein
MNKLKLNIYIYKEMAAEKKTTPAGTKKKEMAVGKERRLEKKRNVRNEF